MTIWNLKPTIASQLSLNQRNKNEDYSIQVYCTLQTPTANVDICKQTMEQLFQSNCSKWIDKVNTRTEIRKNFLSQT